MQIHGQSYQVCIWSHLWQHTEDVVRNNHNRSKTQDATYIPLSKSKVWAEERATPAETECLEPTIKTACCPGQPIFAARHVWIEYNLACSFSRYDNEMGKRRTCQRLHQVPTYPSKSMAASPCAILCKTFLVVISTWLWSSQAGTNLNEAGRLLQSIDLFTSLFLI